MTEDFRVSLSDYNSRIFWTEKNISELNKYKEQAEDIKRKTVELLSIWHKEEQQKEGEWDCWRKRGEWDFWHKEELKRLISRTEEELNEVIFEVIEKLEQTSKGLTDAIDKAEEWKDWQKELLNEEVNAKSKLLRKTVGKLAERDKEYLVLAFRK